MPVTSKPSQLPDTLILPVETLNREFDAKLHLALRAAARGWKVILGGRTAIHSRLPSLPRSVYLAKGIRTGNRRILRLLDSFGHIIVALDEESLIRHSDETLLMMLDEETFNRPRLLYAWGKSDADVWRSFKGFHGQIILEAGNPRADMLRPELSGYYRPQAEALNQRFGEFVLVSSNFSMVNHYIADHVRFRTAAGTNAARREELKDGIRAHKQTVFDAFRAMVPQLARAIAPVTLVVRPHPSENAATWEAAASGLANVRVVHEGPMAPWLMAARALIQNGCTSAVEAAIIGTPALAYHPVVSSQFEVALSDGLSKDCRTPDELLSALSVVLSEPRKPGRQLDAVQTRLLNHHIASIEGALSSERILDSLEIHADVLRTPALHPASYLRGLISHYKRRAVRAVTTRLPGSPSSASYTAHKFPGIGDDLLADGIGRFRAILPQLPPVTWRRIGPSIYEISASN